MFRGRGLRGLGLSLGITLTALLAAAPVQAAFPGTNGKIGFGHVVGGTSRLFTMNPDGSGQASFSGADSGDSPSYSGDGRRVAYQSGSAIVVRNTDGSGTPTVFSPQTVGIDSNSTPALSRDGSLVAFTTRFPAGILSGTSVRRVDGTGGIAAISGAFDPAFGPSGELFYAKNVNPNGTDFDIFKQEPYGDPVAVVTEGVGNVEPEPSPDGTRIAYTRPNGDNDIRLKTIGSNPAMAGSILVSSFPPFEERDASFSPDGKQVAYAQDTDADTLPDEIYVATAVINSIGQNVTKTPTVVDTDPGWSPLPAAAQAPAVVPALTPTGQRAAALKKCKKKKTKKKRRKCRKKANLLPV